jgi:hypothetical protein
MKKLAFILVVALNWTLNAQDIDKDSSNISDTSSLDTEFVDGVMLELSEFHMTHKEGDNDSLTFALMPTLLTNPATKYEFEKINPRIVTDVFVLITTSNGDLFQISFTEWIRKRVQVLDTAIWDISFKSSSTSTVRFEYIKMKNINTGQTRKFTFCYNANSSDGSITNLYAISDN